MFEQRVKSFQGDENTLDLVAEFVIISTPRSDVRRPESSHPTGSRLISMKGTIFPLNEQKEV